MSAAAGVPDLPHGPAPRIGSRLFSVRSHLVVLLLVLLLPAAGLRGYALVAAREASIAEAKRDALALVRQGAGEQRNLLQQAGTLLALVAGLGRSIDPDAASCPALLHRLAADMPAAVRVFVARRDGAVPCWSDGEAPGVVIADRRYFQEALGSDGMASSDFIVTRKDHRPAMTLARAVRDERGEAVAVVAVALDLERLARTIDAGVTGPDTRIVLTDRNGIVLAKSSNAAAGIGASLAGLPAVAHGLSSDGGAFDDAFLDGVGTLGASATIPGSTAKLFVGRPKATVLAAVDAEIRLGLLQFAILALIAGALAWLVAETFLLRWIRRLVEAAGQIGEGGCYAGARLPTVAGDLRLVGDALDAAGDRLAAREAQLRSTERLFHGLFDHLPDMQVVYRAGADGDWVVETWNAAAGARRETLAACEGVRRAASTGEIVKGESEWVDADGKRIVFEVVSIPLAGEASGVARVLRSSRDVTHFRAAVAEAREAARMMRVAEGVAHVGHWRIDFPGEELFWSDEIYRIHGLDKATHAPTVSGSIGLYHPDDRAMVETKVRQAVDLKGYLDFTARLVRPDGDVRSVVIRGFVQEEADERRSMFGVIMDVTELRRAETLLRENSAMLKVTLESMDQGLVMSDPGGRVRVFNRRALDLLGLPPALMASQPQLGEVRAFQERHGEFALAAGAPPTAEDAALFEWTRPTGTVIEMRHVPLPTGGVVQTFTDVTAPRTADAKIRAAEALYRLLAENMSDVVVRLNLALEREYVSPACRSLLGYEPEELVGTSPFDAVHPDDTAAIEALMRRLAALEVGTEGLVATYRMRHRRGHWMWVETGMRLALDEATGRPASIVCSLRDVSERQAHTLELRIAKEAAEVAQAAAEQASHAKSDFLAAMSHEIRTPLNAIIGFGEMLAQAGSMPPEMRRYADIVRSSGSALLTLVNDILDFSKIEAGAVDLEAAPFSPAALIEDCLAITRGAATAKSLPVLSRIDEAVPAMLVGDAARLRQILLNLLNNAIKFTRAGSVSLMLRHDGSGASGERLRFCVIDTGIGIAVGKQHRLFQRFSQADGSISRDFGGTGLGLAISKRLVELMGGEIGVASEEGRGATFWFTLTLPRSRAAGQAPAATVAACRRRGRLLLVDDVEINRELAQAVLADLGHEVEVVGDGAAALRAVGERSYDLVLMDVQMPGMDGMEATRRIRAMSGAASRLPILAMTANVLPAQVREFRKAGMDDHIGKPFRKADLAAAIDRHLPALPEARVEAPGPPDFDRREHGLLVDLVGRDTTLVLMAKLREDLAARFVAEPREAGVWRREAHATVAGAHMLGFPAMSAACRALMQAEDDDFEPARLALAQARERTVASIDEMLHPRLSLVANA